MTAQFPVDFYREIPKDSRSTSHFSGDEREMTLAHFVSWCHREEEGGEGERGGPTMWRRREEGRGVVTPFGGGWRRGEGWSHRVEEEGRGVVPLCGGRGRGGCSAFVRSPLASLGAARGREEEVQHL